MLYHISVYLTQFYSAFNVMHYVSFRSVSALLMSLMFSLLTFPWFIRYSQKLFRAKAREHTPERHRAKDNTPTMGGLLMIVLTILNTLLFCNLYQPNIWIFLSCLISFGGIGAWDDWAKIQGKKGISAALKFSLQIICAACVVVAWILTTTPAPMCVPFFKDVFPSMEWWLVPWGVFVIAGTSNAVNLTDGLDGLAISSLIPNFATFALLAYLAGHTVFAQYLHIPFVMSAELAVIGATLIGVSLGFLWYNIYPAEIFMGDVGSLALGASLALMALITRQELLLPLAGGLFVVETISVIMQVVLFRLTRRRFFKMAPIHHHFELLGWQESKITVRFGIISLVLCLLALITIKIR